MVRGTDAKEVGVGNPAEETYCPPGQTHETLNLQEMSSQSDSRINLANLIAPSTYRAKASIISCTFYPTEKSKAAGDNSNGQVVLWDHCCVQAVARESPQIPKESKLTWGSSESQNERTGTP